MTTDSLPVVRRPRRGQNIRGLVADVARAPFDLPAPRDAADVLAAVYGLILSWPLPEERAVARPTPAAEVEGGGG